MHRLKQRLQHEAPEVKAWMRQLQARVVQPQLTPEQQIQIEAARTPALFLQSVAAELLFQTL